MQQIATECYYLLIQSNKMGIYTQLMAVLSTRRYGRQLAIP